MPLPAMPLTISKATDWDVKNNFIKVPYNLVTCSELTPNSRLLLMFLMDQCGSKIICCGTIDRLLGIHRATRIRCIEELKEFKFLSGTNSHLILNDPTPILAKLEKDNEDCQEEVTIRVKRSVAMGLIKEGKIPAPESVEKRDYMKEATDAWNMYRPKDYQAIRRISAQLIKAVDIHMRDNQIKPHDYKEFFSLLKSGIEQSDFWSTQNTNKTLQSVAGIGTPTDKKRSNVYQLLNAGYNKPAEPTKEEDRIDTIVYPAEYRALISEYEAAQYHYSLAYQDRKVDSNIESYVIRTENALKEVGLDPAKFRYKYGMRTWPTDTPEPAESRVVNWTFEDDRGYAY